MNPPGVTQPTRRHHLRQLAGLFSVLAFSGKVQSQGMTHATLGPVLPRRVAPVLPLTLHSGAASQLSTLLIGKVTALQLMFTGCSSICPLQGAVFASLQDRLGGQASTPWQLLSVSIDALGDDARALAAWRQRFKAGPHWLAAVPAPRNADRLPDFLASRPPPGKRADRHTAQVYLFDSRGRLAYRMAELASADAIARSMAELARLDG